MAFEVVLGADVSVAELEHVVVNRVPVVLGEPVRARVRASREVVDRFVAEGRVIYGVNTSLGGFVDHLVPVSMATELQKNLIRTAATNVGEFLDDTTVRAIIFARIVSLARGNSGISLENLDKLVALLNSDVVPCVPSKGSLGASGDLGPLAAIALVCIGEGRATVGGRTTSGAEALAAAGLTPMELSYKEGLALVNGTSGMVGLGGLAYLGAQRLVETYQLVSALSFEGLAAMTRPFDPIVHRTKPHRGQLAVAERLWTALADSKLAVNEETTAKTLAGEMSLSPGAASAPIEDAYSIRCTPQILGPVVDSLYQVGLTLRNELNSSNDNPIVLPEEQEVYHNGHFHGQYVAMAMDHLVISLATVTNLANRRVDRFLDKSSSNGLPAFLCAENRGLRMGLMGGQFMTASVTAETRATSVPMSVQSLSATGDFQDIVSLGLIGARRAREALVNAAYVVAFELVCACQAVDIRGADGLAGATRQLYERVRRLVPFLDHDAPLTDYLEAVAADLLSVAP
ncbi:histidine ammonia-lyase [Crossiella equi]|uniref:Histidine ammonia-lyase n=1 Tax=Crossiella equi TaxID=130796 RepID=A0ABS5AT08_9PSEU|nr:phenylalanine aminomutase (D-beta-phenylalanine forming) [Crossiella equi]MBP2479715.1 histidine ammonia-lyase [Crossiella equi]